MSDAEDVFVGEEAEVPKVVCVIQDRTKRRLISMTSLVCHTGRGAHTASEAKLRDVPTEKIINPGEGTAVISIYYMWLKR